MASKFVNWIKIYWLELIIFLLGISHQITQKILGLPLVWFDNYFDDLLAVPFVSTCVLWMENFVIYRVHTRKHSFYQLMFLFIIISIFFEFIAPKYSEHYFYDLLDIIYYFLGFVGYYFAKKNLSK
jgi:hypothetical protein